MTISRAHAKSPEMTSNPFLVEPVPPPPADNESMTPRDWMELLGNDWPGSNRNSGREEAPTEDDVVQLEKQLSEASDELEKEMQSEQQHDGSDTRSDYSSMQPGASRADSPHSEDADTPPHQQYPYALSTYKPPKMKQAWTREEDMIILGGVSTFGNKWSKIVAQLPVHRTDDAVRNRWQRLLRKQERADQEAEPTPPPLTGVKRAASFDVGAAASADDTAAFAAMMQQHGAGGTPKASGDLPLQPTRALSLPTPEVAVDQKGGDMWTAEEDRTIDEGVRLEGLRWREIAARLPGRTESGCRNRWVRTQERLFAANGVQVHGAAEVFAALRAAGRITKRHKWERQPSMYSIWHPHAAATAR